MSAELKGVGPPQAWRVRVVRSGVGVVEPERREQIPWYDDLRELD